MCLSESVLTNILLSQPRVMALFPCEFGAVWCVWNLFQSSNTVSGATSSCEGINMCGVGISNCELSRTSAFSFRLGCPVAWDGSGQQTGPFPLGRPSSIAGSLGTWVGSPGTGSWHTLEFHACYSSGMAVPRCRTWHFLGGASILTRTAKCLSLTHVYLYRCNYGTHSTSPSLYSALRHCH